MPENKAQAKKELPIGVRVIAIYYYVSAGLSLIMALLLILFTSLILPLLVKTFAADLEKYMTPSLLQTFITIFSVVLIILLIISAVFSFFIGRGLWNLRKWARVIVIISSGLGMLSSSMMMLYSILRFDFLKIALYIPSLAISVFIFVYLLTDKKVQAAFA